MSPPAPVPTLPFFVCVPPMAPVLSSSSVLALPDALPVLSLLGLPPLSSPASPCAAAEPGDIWPPPRPPLASPAHVWIFKQSPSRMRLQAPQRACVVLCGEEGCEKATHQPCPGSPSSWTCSLRHADFLLTLPSVHHYCLELWWSCPLLLIPLQSLCKCWAARNACKTTTSGGEWKAIGAKA